MSENETDVEKETCPRCGRDVHIEMLKFGDISRPLVIGCVCSEIELEREKTERQERGTVHYHISAQRGAGLCARHRTMTFQSIVPKTGQKEAFEICEAYAAAWTINTDKGLILNGPAGSGKSHLAAAICNDIIDRTPVNDGTADRYSSLNPLENTAYSGMLFISAYDLFGRLKSAYNNGEDAEAIMARFKKVRLLIIDDIGAEKQSEWSLEKLFEIIDHRYNEFQPLIVTTNLTAQEMKNALGDRIADRLRSMCKLVNITSPSQRVTA